MFTYQCLFCGVKYASTHAMSSCTVCGQTATSGWLREEPREPATTARPRALSASPYRSPMLKSAA